MTGWAHFCFSAFPLVPSSLSTPGGAQELGMEQAWCQLEQRMEANTTLVFISQQVSQSLFQCLL